MKKAVLVIMVAVYVLLSACAGKSPGQIEKITIVYSGNIGGRKNPCGCRPPMGGLYRRDTVINSIREYAENLLVLDSGALLYPSNFLAPPTDYVFRRVSPLMARIMDEIGIDGVNVSNYDLANSVDSLLVIDEATSFPWLSANLTRRASGEPVFAPDITVEKGTVKVGIFGIMADNFMGAPLYGEDSPLEVLDPLEAAAREVDKLKGETDLVIALAYMSKNEVNELVDRVDGIDLVIHSHNVYHTPTSNHEAFQPITRNNTLIVRCPDGGRVLGLIALEVVDGDTHFRGLTGKEYLIRNQQAASPENGKLESIYFNEFVDLGTDIASNEKIKAEIETLDASLEEYKKLHKIKTD